MLLPALFLLLQNPDTNNYINRISHKVFPAAEVRLVSDPDVRASVMQESGIEVSSGLFARLQNEAELAGILAHEGAHLALKTECVRFVKAPHPDGRRNERDADERAIQVLMKAGYDPAAMLNFFSKYRREVADLPKDYSAEDLIIEKLQIEATDHPVKDAIVNTPEFERVHGLLK